MVVKDLLEKKGRSVITIDSRKSVDDAVDRMASAGVGALIVTENERPVGIFAERDVLRIYMRDKNADFAAVPLSEAMTNRLISAGIDDSIGTVMTLMLQAGIRHLPVIENAVVVGMLTINDLVQYRLDSMDAELHHLKDYIADLHDAGHD
ncbi:MAG TPA: CBS domain-containing protein [Desulfobacterales bacterium]